MWVSSVTERRQKVTRSATSASCVDVVGAPGESGPTRASPSAPTSAAAVSSTSWGGQLAGGDAVAQDVGEAGGVGAAEDQALGLDGRVDRLGEQRPGQAAAAQRAAREGLDRGGEPRRRRAAGRLGGGARGVDLALRGARGRPRRTGRPWTGSGGRRCRWRPRPPRRRRRPAPRGSRRGAISACAARTIRSRAAARRASVRSVGRYGT